MTPAIVDQIAAITGAGARHWQTFDAVSPGGGFPSPATSAGAIATIQNGRDALSADNEAIASPTKVN